MANRLFQASDGIEEDAALEIYDGDYTFYKLVLETFQKEIVKTVDGMQKTFAAADVENYRILVHGLKGSGASAGAKHLVELATESNALIKEGRWPEAAKYHEPMISELERLIQLIPERLAEHK